CEQQHNREPSVRDESLAWNGSAFRTAIWRRAKIISADLAAARRAGKTPLDTKRQKRNPAEPDQERVVRHGDEGSASPVSKPAKSRDVGYIGRQPPRYS